MNFDSPAPSPRMVPTGAQRTQSGGPVGRSPTDAGATPQPIGSPSCRCDCLRAGRVGAEMSYKTWVALHGVGAAILIGNLVVTAAWKTLADRTCEPHAGRTRETGDDHRRRVRLMRPALRPGSPRRRTSCTEPARRLLRDADPWFPASARRARARPARERPGIPATCHPCDPHDDGQATDRSGRPPSGPVRARRSQA